MADLRGFAINIRKRAKTLEKRTDELVKQAAVNVLDSLAYTTPADKGTARSNWLVGINSRPNEILPAHVAGSKGSSAEACAKITVDRGIAVIARYRAGAVIKIVNNLPYIGLLNNGSSVQAPAGFVQVAAAKANQFLRSVRKLTS